MALARHGRGRAHSALQQPGSHGGTAMPLSADRPSPNDTQIIQARQFFGVVILGCKPNIPQGPLEEETNELGLHLSTPRLSGGTVDWRRRTNFTPPSPSPSPSRSPPAYAAAVSVSPRLRRRQPSMVDWISDSNDSDMFDWESDGEAEPLSALALNNLDAPGPSMLDVNGWSKGKASSASLVEEYVRMGYPKEIVLKAVKAIGYNYANEILELLLAFKALVNYPSMDNCFTSGCTPYDVENDHDDNLENWDDGGDDADERGANSNNSSDEAEPLSASTLSNLDALGPSTLVLGNYPSVDNCFASGCTPPDAEDDSDLNDGDLDFQNWDNGDHDAGKREANSNGSSDEAEPLSASVLRNLDARGPSTLGVNGWAKGDTQSSYLVDEYVGMGYPKEIVLKAVKAIGYSDGNELLELLLTFKTLCNYPSMGNCFTSGCTTHDAEDDDDHDIDFEKDDDDDDIDFENWDDDDDDVGETDGSSDQDFPQAKLEKDEKIKSLVDAGFPEDRANMAITSGGVDDALFALFDSKNFYAPEVTNVIFNSLKRINEGRFMEKRKKKRKRCGGGAQGNWLPLDGSDEEAIVLPNPMVGFSLPNSMVQPVNRSLPEQAIRPPFFYYENVAQTPKGSWSTISRSLYGVEPEFVDSIYICATARKRGYIHNLPIENRSSLCLEPPKTIFEAFPHYRKWWPSWDSRRQLNCLSTCVPSAKLTELIDCALSEAGDPPSLTIQKYVMAECRKYNLVWVGKNKVAHLEPHEMEHLLGFPRDHTRRVARTERYKSLGNSFQVDTVTYHLSVLRNMFPDGINVLSLFTGIGGGEVALHRLGIHMRRVISVEISEVNRRILRSCWWKQTQTGELFHIPDVKTLTDDKIKSLIERFGGFDLVIGDSPCNNLAGRNRFHRDGLEGEHSALFYEYSRILATVKSVMARV
ncbi:DNA (cytosine-5)-methyltransferase DRM2 [Hordeum vulgare]|nr:DNA (cytosine-5)-methyltransferase DRM2 [Hordeum vulgare]